MKNSLIIVALFFSLHGNAKTFKCVENSEVVVNSEKPCDPGTEWPFLSDEQKSRFNLDIAGVRLWMTESQAIRVDLFRFFQTRVIRDNGLLREERQYEEDALQ